MLFADYSSLEVYVYLKKLVIVGFKSFAEKTTFHFDAGVTCIVGPNGCGKSNVVDAFRWVLGEQSAKSMRGNKMPDVIFSGTSQRKSLNIAEVSLTLADVQGALPIEYEEVTLTRRLHRNGESDYLINGHVVRLKDVQNLFLDSGMGRHAFSIFEQGKIDQVINYSPLERRYIFEEAAGILRFLQRKREALKRLEQADQNLDRVKDIHKEVEQHILVLKKQAEKAKIFKENQAQLEELEKGSYALRWGQLEKKWVEAEKKQQAQKQVMDDLSEGFSQLQARNQETKVSVQQQEKNFRTKSEELYKIGSEKEIHTREHLSNQEYLKEAQHKEKKLKRELEELKITQQSRQKALQEIQQKQKKIEVEWNEIEGHLVSQQDKVKEMERRGVQLQLDLNAKQKERLKGLQIESQLESECKQNEVRWENNKERKKQGKERETKLTEELKLLSQQAQEKKVQLGQVSALVDTHKDRLELYEEELKKNGQEIERVQKDLELVKRKNVEQKARQKVLLKMREEREGFSSGSKKLLKMTEDPSHELYGKIRPLYEFLDSDATTAEAFAIILRPYTQTLVVEKEEDFLRVLDLTQQHTIQDYSLVCLEWINRLTLDKKISKKALVKYSSNAVSAHFLNKIEEAEDHRLAIDCVKDSHQEVWSQQKGFFDRYHVFFSPGSNENQVFLRESELKKLEEELVEGEDKLLQCEKHLQHLTQQKSKVQLERLEVDKMLRRDEMKLVEINFGLQRALGDQEKIKAEYSQIQKDLVGLEEQIERQQELLEQIRNKHFTIKQEVVQLNQTVEFLEKEVGSHNQALRIQQQSQREKNDYYQQLNENKQHLLHQFHLLEAKEQEHSKQEQRLEEELADTEELQGKMKEKGIHFHHHLEEIENRLKQAKASCDELEKQLEVNKEALNRTDQELTSHLNHMRKQDEVYNQLSIQVAQYRSSAQSLEMELQERYHLSIEEAQALIPPSKSLEQIERHIKGLRQALQEAGDVNMTSIEELEKSQVRYDFLNQQMEDMSKSKEELIHIISQLDTQSRQLFKETFEEIRENFKKNFQILFNGGEADLHLTGTENILEAGIEIIARPPGKQMRSITLLSGGEKCLTAVALLFAIFEVKPAPFCILDEIDAPLDDTNVERFVNVVKHFADRCQFLIITHNKRTMAVGDVLFGISMEEKGVSKVLSLEFSHEPAPEAALVT